MIRLIRNASRTLLQGLYGVAVEFAALGALLAVAALIALALTRLA